MVVTAENGTQKTYTIAVNRASATPSSNSSLSALSLSSGTLSPSFSASKTVYSVSVANSTSSITVTPTEGQSAQTITVNGTTVNSGSASSSIALSVGQSIISVVVTAEDKTQKIYTVVVNRASAAQSSDASLSALSLSSGTLSPSFASNKIVYSASVTNGTSSITVTPTEGHSEQTITVNGTAVSSGSASSSISLSVGQNIISVVVTAEDNTQKTYTVVVNRASATQSNNADLSAISLSIGTLSPSFGANKTVYSASVSNSTSSITVTPTEGQSGQSITVNGTAVASDSASSSLALSVGQNIISVVVTAENNTQKTYTVVVTRAGADQSSNTNLSALSLSNGTLSPVFSASKTVYSASVANSTSNLTVTPTEEQSAQTITVNGTSVTSGSASSSIALSTGQNIILVVVTAEDGTQKTYTVVVNRANAAKSGNANLSALSLSSGTLSPSFDADHTVYMVDVLNSTSTIKVTPTEGQSAQTIKVNGTSVNSGEASGAVALQVGNNPISVLVIAENGRQKSYLLFVHRASATPSSNASLGGLSLSSGTLFPSFSTNKTVYSASVTNSTASITITPTEGQSDQTITINGATVSSGSASSSIALSVGKNIISLL